MKITVEIPDEEIREAAKEAIVRDIVREAAQKVKTQTFPDSGYGEGMTHHLYAEIRKITREILREHMDEIIPQAVDAAAVSIEKKGLKKLLDKAADS